ncbi:hypothetical protein DSY1389 [Desulfitobacterium hafniense Y51]|uniref:Putative amidase domain-containing protein n=2 Tax=Desulfitobacterium hafniense TaxID=49338 RepID=Q24XR4_DESHY|nr:hypothetical protein DSY1389 [Desulfitobacterium hafniense Y51]
MLLKGVFLMKKFAIRALSFVAFITLGLLLSVPVFAASVNTSKDDMISTVEKAIALFYENKDMGANNDLSKIMDTDISSYLADKATTHQYATSLNQNDKENYSVQVKFLENEMSEDFLKLKFQVITTYNYASHYTALGERPDISTVSEVVYVVYDRVKNLITDFYCPTNYYDIAVRDEDPNISMEMATRSAYPFAITANITARQEMLKNDIYKVYEEQNSEVSSITPSRTSFLSPNAILAYARANYDKINPSSGNGTVPYFDFSVYPGNWDCTNFVSHALLAGGANVYDTGGSGISGTGWYFRSESNRSSSWSGVPELYNFLISNTHPNTPAGYSYAYSNNPGLWSVGDIVQFRFSGNSVYSHSTIITRKVYSADQSRAYAYVTGRSDPYNYNDNDPVDNMAPGGSKRTIYVYNY